MLCPVREKTLRPCRAVDLGDHRVPGRRPRRGAGGVAEVDLEREVTQAGGDLQRLQVGLLADVAQGRGDLGLGHPEEPQVGLGVGLGAGEDLADRIGRQRVVPHRADLARRTRQHQHRRPAALAVGRDGEARRGAGRTDRRRPARHHRLLAVGGGEGVGVPAQPVGELRDDVADHLLHVLVQLERAPGLGGDHLAGEVVGGRPEAPGRHDEVDAVAGEEAQRGGHVLGAVADEQQVGHLDPELAEPFGHPGAVAIGDPPGQQLAARRHDPGPHTRARPLPVVGHAAPLSDRSSPSSHQSTRPEAQRSGAGGRGPGLTTRTWRTPGRTCVGRSSLRSP